MGSRSWWTRQKAALGRSAKAIGHGAKFVYGEIKGVAKVVHDDVKDFVGAAADKLTSPLDAITKNLPLILIGGVVVIALLPRLLDSAGNAQRQISN